MTNLCNTNTISLLFYAFWNVNKWPSQKEEPREETERKKKRKRKFYDFMFRLTKWYSKCKSLFVHGKETSECHWDSMSSKSNGKNSCEKRTRENMKEQEMGKWLKCISSGNFFIALAFSDRRVKSFFFFRALVSLALILSMLLSSATSQFIRLDVVFGRRIISVITPSAIKVNSLYFTTNCNEHSFQLLFFSFIFSFVLFSWLFCHSIFLLLFIRSPVFFVQVASTPVLITHLHLILRFVTATVSTYPKYVLGVEDDVRFILLLFSVCFIQFHFNRNRHWALRQALQKSCIFFSIYFLLLFSLWICEILLIWRWM